MLTLLHIDGVNIEDRAMITAYDWAVGQVKMNQRNAPVARGGPGPTNTWRKVISTIGVNDELWRETQ